MMSPPVVVTGVGLRSPLGATRGELLEAILSGASGLRPSRYMEGEKNGDVYGEFDGGPNDAFRAEALLAECLKDACDEGRIARDGSVRLTVLLGTTLNGMRHLGEYLRTGRIRPAAHVCGSAVIADAASRVGLPSAGITLSTACASGITTIGCACDLLRSGAIDAALAGGYDPASEFSFAGFGSLRLLAAKEPRPFSRHRDGMRTSEAFAVLLLEREEDARRRGARILARISGVGESSDAFHLTQPHPAGEGAALAVRRALGDEGPPDLVVAHATGTPANDGAEYRCYASVFGDSLASIPITAPKSRLGHTLGATGALDAALCIAMAEHGTMIATATPEADIDRAEFGNLRLLTAPRRAEVRRTLNVALGFGGANAALVLEHHVESGRARTLSDAPCPAVPAVVTGVSLIAPGVVARGVELGSIDALQTGDVDETLIAPYLDERACRRVSKVSRLVRAAVRLAALDAGLDQQRLAESEAFCATQHGAMNYTVQCYREVLRDGRHAGNPLLFAESVPNVASAQCALGFGMRGAAISVIGSRAGFLESLWLAQARMAARGSERVVIVAAEEHHEHIDIVLNEWHQGGVDGALSGAGAVALVLESEAAARARGARVLARPGPVNYAPPQRPRVREVIEAARRVTEGFDGPISAMAGRGLLGRIERRAAGDRLAGRIDGEFSAVGPAFLYARLCARGADGCVLAVDPFGAAAAAGVQAVAAPSRPRAQVGSAV